MIGTDVSARSLEIARGLYQTHYGAQRVLFCQPQEPASRAEIDLAFCNGVFHHIKPEDRAAAVNYIFRSLRPGGLFALWENNPWNLGTRYVMAQCSFDRDAQTIAPPQARRLLRNGGFEIARTDFLFIFPRALAGLRFIEPHAAHLPLGTQYMVLARKP